MYNRPGNGQILLTLQKRWRCLPWLKERQQKMPPMQTQMGLGFSGVGRKLYEDKCIHLLKLEMPSPVQHTLGLIDKPIGLQLLST
jgi:hypothetical protein